MLKRRAAASVVNLNESELFVVGGYTSYNEKKSTNSSEFISLDKKPRKGPDIHFEVSFHCMLYYNSSTIYLIGGDQGNVKASDKTWIINPTKDFDIQEGPTLKIGRRIHSCGKIEKNGTILLVVAAGFDGTGNGLENGLDSVEILDPSTSQGWTSGE